MIVFDNRGSEIWRDYNTEGVPSSGPYEPRKSLIRAWSAAVEYGATRVVIVRAASIANVDISALSAGSTLDGIVLSAGDIVLLKNQSNSEQNGLYEVAADAGDTQRYLAFSRYDDYPQAMVIAEVGTVNENSFFVCTSSPGGTIDTTAIIFATRTQGPIGPQGQGISPDATGSIAERDAYDDEPQGFTYLRTDVSPFLLYVKASASSGDWAGPSQVTSVEAFAMAVCDGRLSLTTGAAETLSDVVGATTLRFVPDQSNRVGLYNAVSGFWEIIAIDSEPTIKATDTQTGTTSSSSAVITGLTDTSQMVVGMEVTSAGVPASRVIASIDSATQVTMNGNGSLNFTGSVTFRLPANKNFDVYGYLSGGTMKLELSQAWLDNETTPARASQDGVAVKSGAPTRRLLGSIGTTAIAGELEDSRQRRLVSNLENTRGRPLLVREANFNWTYEVSSMRITRGAAGNKVEILNCVDRMVKLCAINIAIGSSGGARFGAGIGIDTAILDSSVLRIPGYTPAINVYVAAQAYYSGNPGIGRHSFNWLEYGSAGITFFGTAAAAGLQDIVQSGMAGEVEG